jgi:peptidoglycan/xylan/chitin deacetylase (PgdA/CDA1 family)
MKKLGIIISLLFFSIMGFWVYLTFNYEVPILMYHSLDASRVDVYAAVSPKSFRQQMKFIDKHGYDVTSLSDYCKLINENKPVPKNTVVITFDDGHKDNVTAVEILKEFDYPATIFIIGNKIGKKGYMTKDDILAFLENSKVDIGSHTLNEVYLPDADVDTIHAEIHQSKTYLQQAFNREIDIFSYTIGGFNNQALEEVKKAGYICACTTNRGFDREIDSYALRRIKVTERDRGIRFWAKLSGFYNFFKSPKKPF